MEWNSQQVETLKRLWTAGFSASKIAAELGEPGERNAVIGKARRLDLEKRRPPTRGTWSQMASNDAVIAARIPPRTKGDNNPLGIKGVNGIVRQPLPAPDKTLQAMEAEAPPAEFLGIPFDDLKPQHCRYPRGDGPMLFCGQKQAPDSSYCRACHARCYSKPQPRVLTDDESQRRSLSARRMHARAAA